MFRDIFSGNSAVAKLDCLELNQKLITSPLPCICTIIRSSSAYCFLDFVAKGLRLYSGNSCFFWYSDLKWYHGIYCRIWKREGKIL